MNKDKVIDIAKAKSVYDIAGSWVWQYGRWQNQYTWIRTEGEPYLFNSNTGEKIKGLKNIKEFVKFNNLVLELF